MNLSEQINMNATEIAKDDDYSLSQDLFDLMCNDDNIRAELNRLTSLTLEERRGVDIYCAHLRLAQKMTKFAAEFYTEHAEDFIND